MSNPEFVRPDRLYGINFNSTGERFEVSIATDRIDYYEPLGAFVLKVFQPEEGYLSRNITPNDARAIMEHTDLVRLNRPWIYSSELDLWIAEECKDMDSELDN